MLKSRDCCGTLVPRRKLLMECRRLHELIFGGGKRRKGALLKTNAHKELTAVFTVHDGRSEFRLQWTEFSYFIHFTCLDPVAVVSWGYCLTKFDGKYTRSLVAKNMLRVLDKGSRMVLWGGEPSASISLTGAALKRVSVLTYI